jgi:hypothetical protein
MQGSQFHYSVLLGCFLCLADGSAVGAQSADQSTSGAAVVQRFLARPDEPLTRYRALRRLEARNSRFDVEGWLEAWTELAPDGRFKYEIVREGGSDYIRSKVLKPLLENEALMFASGEAARSALTAENYELRCAESGEPGLAKLEVTPKRREVSLIEGALYVKDLDADLVRLEGRLSKNPSFWTKRVDVVKHYSRLQGIRVPVRVDSVAQMRLAGMATLSMTYEYEMINGIVMTPVNAIASRSR